MNSYDKESSSHLSNREKECYPVLLWHYVSHYLFSIHLLLLFFFYFPEKFQHFTGLRPRAANNSKLNQAPYTQHNNNKKSLFQDFLNPLTQKEERLVPGQSTLFTIRDVSRKVDFIYVMLHSARLHIPFPFCYTLPSFSSENPFMNNLNELFEACIPT